MIELPQVWEFSQAYILNMKQKLLFLLFIALVVIIVPKKAPIAVDKVYSSNEHLLGKAQFSLEDRYAVKSVNDVFKDNILLTYSYMAGEVKDPTHVNWTEVRRDRKYTVTLNPGEVFAFHEDVLPEFKGKVVKTTNAHFGAQEGFLSDGYLVADGVCHFASLINLAAHNAGLKVVAPTNHDFARIPEVAREYGTAIYYMPGSSSTNQMQNLYVENTKTKPINMVFDYSNKELSISIYE